MRKMTYPDDIDPLLEKYKNIFPIADMQNSWTGIRNDLKSVHSDTDFFDSIYPTSIEDILIADYPKLVDIYVDYCNNRMISKISNNIDESLKELFNYSGDYPNSNLRLPSSLCKMRMS